MSNHEIIETVFTSIATYFEMDWRLIFSSWNCNHETKLKHRKAKYAVITLLSKYLSHEAIADLLSKSQSTVRGSISHAKRFLDSDKDYSAIIRHVKNKIDIQRELSSYN